MSDTEALQRIASPDHTFSVVALDQRGTMRRMFAAVGQPEVADAELVAVKEDIIDGLAGVASAFLVDPDYGMEAARSHPKRASFGVLLAAEPASRGTHDGAPTVTLDPNQPASWVREQGADAMKFLCQIRADRPVGADGRDLTAEAVGALRELIADCAQTGVPSVVENLIYALPGAQSLTPEQRADAIVEAAALIDALQPSLLKLEYPGSPEACRRLASRLTRPWAVLSAGVPMAQFAEVLRISCDEGGASGFIAGRAIWAEAVGMPRDQRQAFLGDEGRRRLDECVSVIDGRARPFTEVTP
jgi:tagatose-1,6-bisphosphate aldolase